MELRQLVSFDAVARLGGFTRAAEELVIAQPAVSAHIRRLEAELGTVLLHRTTRRVALTHSGEVFWSRVRAVLHQLEGARADLDELLAVQRGRVRIGATPMLGSLQLPSALAHCRRRFPGVRLALRTGLIAELLAALDDGDIDFVLGPVHAGLADRFATEALVDERLVLVSAPGRHAAGTLSTLGSARDELFVCLPIGSGLRTLLLDAAGAHRCDGAEGFVPRVEFETDSPGSIRELVAVGVGVALIPESAARGPGPAVDIHLLESPPPHPPFGLIARADRGQSAAAHAVRDEIRRELAGQAIRQA
ncbi:MAG: LysR family transcriptional regulator [Acidimicrobiales bacterium]